ncbi:N-acetyltransferase [Streptomyces antioxidans]|uniref:N-acetyltransferase n=1 Tax=Streptomyces antioxidans TaxID=1507734 RepID=A0A1V4D5Y0_9ACTN|nr:GNAT family N-acetyltransferase [Streptomyces antioxidans]OPF79661.1 N-acetyltransferase [Streptomyces antioxidans]
MTATLRTARLLLEPYRPDDEDAFVALFQDRRVCSWLGDGRLAPEAQDRALFGRIFTQVYARRLFDVWAVREDGRYVGHAEIKPTELVGGHEIVYALAPEAWGRGLGRELAEAVVGHGFGALGLSEVHATVMVANEASLALLTRLGFAHRRDIEEDDGTTTRWLSLVRADRAPGCERWAAEGGWGRPISRRISWS